MPKSKEHKTAQSLTPMSFFRGFITIGVSSFGSLLTLCSMSVFVHPERMPWLGVLWLCFPVFLAVLVFFGLLVLFFHRRRWWLPICFLGLNFFSIRNYVPFNLPGEVPEGCIKVLTYNTEHFGRSTFKKTDRNLLAKYIGDQEADIICLQETEADIKFIDERILAEIRRGRTLYIDSINTYKTSPIMVLSRYPIVKKKLISRNKINICGAFEMLLPDGDTLSVVNCHLKTMGLSKEDKANFSGMVHAVDSLPKPHSEDSLFMMITKMSVASVERAKMVDDVCAYLKERRGHNVILCGDFNDTPVSYAHQRFSYYLTDCFVSSGQGFGRTFNRSSIFVRIDNIFCSSHWKPYDCHVDTSPVWSDHYPMVCKLKRQ